MRMSRASATPGGGRWRQIHFEDRHLERVRSLTFLFILENHADELAADMDLDRVRLPGTLEHADRVEPEQIAEILFEAPNLAAGHVARSRVRV